MKNLLSILLISAFTLSGCNEKTEINPEIKDSSPQIGETFIKDKSGKLVSIGINVNRLSFGVCNDNDYDFTLVFQGLGASCGTEPGYRIHKWKEYEYLCIAGVWDEIGVTDFEECAKVTGEGPGDPDCDGCPIESLTSKTLNGELLRLF